MKCSNVVIAYGFDDGQSEAVAFYPFRRTVEAAENQFLVHVLTELLYFAPREFLYVAFAKPGKA